MKTHGFTEFVAAFTHIDLGQHRAKVLEHAKNPVAASETALIMPNQTVLVIQQLTQMKFADMQRLARFNLRENSFRHLLGLAAGWMPVTLLLVEAPELLVPVEGANLAVIQCDAAAVGRLPKWRLVSHAARHTLEPCCAHWRAARFWLPGGLSRVPCSRRAGSSRDLL